MKDGPDSESWREPGFATFSDYRTLFDLAQNSLASRITRDSLFVYSRFANPRGIDAAIEASLEHHAKLVFKDLDSSATKVVESPEIATFAVEYMAFRRISLQDCLKIAHADDDKAALLSGIMRNALANDFVRENVAHIKNYISTEVEERLEIIDASLCAALVKHPGAVDYDFVLTSRMVLSRDAWRYLLFEIANTEDSAQLLRRILDLDDLGLIERAIAIFGTRDGVGSATAHIELIPLAQQLAVATDEAEQLAGMEPLGLLNFSDEYLLTLYADLLTTKSSARVRQIAADLLGTLDTEKAWRGVRRLWTREPDPKLRTNLQAAERKISG